MKISVVVPILNPGARELTNMIKSYIIQDYKEKELIIIDGGSVDGTLDVIKKYEKYIDYWVSEPDGSAFEALLKGVKKASGDFVSFCGGSDFYSFSAFEYAAEAYEKEGGDVLYGDFLMGDERGYRYVKAPEKRLDRLMYAAPFGYMGTFIRKTDMLDVWAEFKGNLGDDTYLFSTLYRRGKKFTRIISDIWLQALSYGGLEYTRRYEWATEDRKASYQAISDSPDLLNRYSEEIEKNYARRIFELWEKIYPDGIQDVFDQVVPKDGRYIIFGTGDWGKIANSDLVGNERHVDYFIDNSKEKQDKLFCRKKVYSPSSLLEEKNCIVMISSLDYMEDMKEQLEKMNLSESIKIMVYVDIPYYIYKIIGDKPLEDAYAAKIIR